MDSNLKKLSMRWLFLPTFLIFCGISPQLASAVSIVATAEGSQTPPIVNRPSIQNGSFTVTPIQEGVLPLGDGVDEFTTWIFDFNSDPNLPAFLNAVATGQPLTSAKLTLTLLPMNSLATDSFSFGADALNVVPRVLTVPNVSVLIGNPTLEQPVTLELNLLTIDPNFIPNSTITSTQILAAFNSSKVRNTLRANYQDDAIISFAQLELGTATSPSTTTVPEPGVVSGLLSLAFSLLVFRQK